MATLDELSVLITAQTKSFETAMKQAQDSLDRLSKSSTNSTTKLQQSFDKLNVSQVSKKIDQVRISQEKLKKAFESGIINAGQFSKSNNALSAFGNNLSGLQAKLNPSQSSIKGIGSNLTALINPATLSAGAVVGLAVGFGKIVDAGKELEKSKAGLAGLINATTQFSDSTGRALNPAENLNASIQRSGKLYEELRKQAILLADIETPELLQNAVIALPQLSVIGITEAGQQAELIGTITASIKQLGIATSEIEAKKELQAFLQGDTTGAGVEFAKLVAQVNGGTQAFEANYKEAVKNGQAYEFLSQSLLAFRASSELSASTLSNKFSVLNDSVNLITSTIGASLNPALKELVQSGIDSVFVQGKDGAVTFNEELLNTSKLIGEDFGKALSALEPLVKPTFDLIVNSIKLVASVLGDTVGSSKVEFATMGELVQTFADIVGALANRIGGVSKIIIGMFRTLSQTAITAVRVVGLSVVSATEKFLLAVQNLVNGTIGIYNNFANSVNGIIGKSLIKTAPKVDFKIDRAGTKAFASATMDSVESAFSGMKLFDEGFKQLAIGKPLVKATTDTTIQDNLSSSSKAVLGGDDKKGGKSKSGKGEANRLAKEAENLNSVKLEQVEQGKLNTIKQASLDIERQISTLKLASGQNENLIKNANIESEIAKAKLENEKALSDLAFQKRENEIKQLQASGQLTKAQATEKLNALNQEKASSDLLLANKLTDINYSTQLKNLELERKNIENEKQIAIQEANNQQTTKVGAMQAELQTLQNQLNYLVAHKGANSEIEALKLKIKTKEDEILATTQSINTELNARLTTLGLEGTNIDANIEKTRTQLDLEKQRNSISSQKAGSEEKFTSACNKSNEALDIAKNAAQQLGQGLVNAFEDGKVSAEEFGKIGLEIVSQVLSAVLDVGMKALSSGMGGGGGGFSLGGLGGFARGGYTGSGGVNEPAGIVHRGEVVFSQSDIKALGGLRRVESIRRGYASGGIVNMPSLRSSPSIRIPKNSNQTRNASVVNIHVTSMDSQDTIRALTKKDVQNHLFGVSTNAVQKTSQKSFNRSTMEFSRGG